MRIERRDIARTEYRPDGTRRRLAKRHASAGMKVSRDLQIDASIFLDSRAKRFAEVDENLKIPRTTGRRGPSRELLDRPAAFIAISRAVLAVSDPMQIVSNPVHPSSFLHRPSSVSILTVLLLVERAVAATTAEGVRLGVALTAVDSQPVLFALQQLQLLTKREYPV